MAHVIHQNLFSWQEVDDSSDLYRLQLVLSYLPDEAMVDRLERNRGRDTYPVRAMWNALPAGRSCSIRPWSRCCGSCAGTRSFGRCAAST